MIELNFNQILTLQNLQSQGNYPEAYRYMRDIVRDLQSSASTLEQAMEYESLQNWLDVAAKINANDGSFESEVVRGSTEGYGEIIGVTISDAKFQEVSNGLAKEVIKTVVDGKGIPDSSTIVKIDVANAVKNLGLPAEGWAGTLGDVLPTWMMGLGKDYQTLPKGTGWREWARNLGKAVAANGMGFGRWIDRAVKDFFNNAKKWQPIRDPLTFDLNGNGLDTVGINTANPLMFDHDGDGIKTSSGWVKADDGFLVLDRNGNSMIDNGKELFGDATPLNAGGKAVDGFAALAQEDTNADGKVDQSDAKWAQLRIWRDLNQDGQSQSNELFTLASLNIASIKVAKEEHSLFLPNGNEIADLGSYTKTDGSSGTIGEVGKVADINLAQDTFTSHFTDTIPLAAGVNALPNMSGSGVVRSLREAASLNTDAGRALKAKLEAFTAATTYTAQHALLDDLIIAWGATGNLTTSTIINQSTEDAKRFNTLEKFNGATIFTQTANVSIEDGRKLVLDEAWKALSDSIYQTLLTQTRFKPLLDQIELVIDAAGPHLDLTKVTTYFQQLMTTVSVDNLGDLIEFNRLVLSSFEDPSWPGYYLLENVVRTTPITPELTQIYATLGSIIGGSEGQVINVESGDGLIFGGAGNDFINGGSGRNLIFGGVGNDFISGGGGDDILDGGDGNDQLNGGSGDDILIGGAGDDFLAGGTGNNTYVWGLGAGRDKVDNAISNRIDRIRITGGLTISDLLIRRYDKNLWIGVIGTTDSIQVSQAFVGDIGISAESMISEILFEDGSRLSANDIVIRSMIGSNLNDNLIGFDSDDNLFGNGGDDVLEGGLGNDQLNGGMGNDYLRGGDGNDVYQFDFGWGQDKIIDLKGKSLIQFGIGITQSNLVFTLNNDDLIISDSRNDSKITFTAYSSLGDTEYLTSEIIFQDGAKISLQEVLNNILAGSSGNDRRVGTSLDDTINGLEGDDTLDGLDGNDTLIGGIGDDVLLGGKGDDVYKFGRKQGSDLIVERSVNGGFGGNDKIIFDSDVLPSDVTVFRNASVTGNYSNSNIIDDLVFVIDGSPQQIRIVDYFSTDKDMAVESVVFGNGIIWSKSDVLSKITGQPNLPVTLTATTGDDLFLVNNSLDNIVGGAGGRDRVISSVSYVLPQGIYAQIELVGTLNINASSGKGNIIGNSGNNIIRQTDASSFWSGSTLIGGAGDDQYFVRSYMNRNRATVNDVNSDSIADAVIENAGEGYDTIITTAYNATLPANVEKLVVSGDGMHPDGVSTYIVNRFLGNDLNNIIDASGIKNGNPRIDGGKGSDIMIGSDGDDTFVVDNVGDVVIESRVENHVDPYSKMFGDTVEASISYTLGVNIENLILTGAEAISGFGNDGNNRLDGSINTAVNHLSGGKGDDVYVVGVGDVVHENEGEGNDTISFTQAGVGRLSDYANIENILLEDSSLTNTVVGDDKNNVISGNARSNQLIGGNGDDIIYDNTNQGFRLNYSGRWELSQDTDILIGGSGNDQLISYSGADTLDGGEGDDQLFGGKGDTTFVFGHGYGHDRIVSDAGNVGTQFDGDVVLFNADVRSNEVKLSRNGQTLTISLTGSTDVLDIEGFFADTSSMTLNDSIEKMVFSDGSYWNIAAILSRLTYGNTNLPTIENDVLTAGNADDVIDGLAGDDTIQGDGGNDNLSGGGGNDLLFGGLGNDVLIGGVGNDILIGGAGADTYRFSRGFGQDVIEETGIPSTINNEMDTIVFAADITKEDVRVEFGVGESETAIFLKIQNSSDQIELRSSSHKTNWSTYSLYDNSVERVQFADGTIWTSQDLLNKANGQANRAPIIAMPLIDQVARQNSEFTFTVPYGTFTDPDLGNNLSYSATLSNGSALPSWLNFDAVTNKFSGIPLNLGVTSVAITVKDGGNLSATDTFDIVVGNVNQLLTGTNGNDNLFGDIGDDTITGLKGNDLMSGGKGNDRYIFNIGDGEDTIYNQDISTSIDTLSFSAGISDADVFASKAGNSLIFRFRNNTDRIVISDYYKTSENIDGQAADYKIDKVEFSNGVTWNQAMIQTMVDRATYNVSPKIGVGLLNSYQVQTDTFFNIAIPENAIFDSDVGDSLTYSIQTQNGTDLPNWLNFNPITRVISGKPPATNSISSFNLMLTGSDNYNLSLGLLFNIDVSGTAINQAPLIAVPLVDQSASMNMVFTYNVPNTSFTDFNEGDTLTYSAKLSNGSALPSWLTFNERTKVFSGTPTSVGTTSVTVTANDSGNLSVADTFDIVVGIANLTINGTNGNDTLTGDIGNDTITGLAGNDLISGGKGNDIYVFNRGDGQDKVDNKDFLTAMDTLRFATGVVDTDVLAFKSGNHLLFKLKNSTDQVTINNYYAANTTLDGQAADYKIDKVEFSNAVSWNQAMIQTMVDRATNNKAPIMGTALPNLNAKTDTLFNTTVPVNTIVDSDVGDTVTYSLKMKDGTALPAWLSFNATTRVISGTPAASNAGTLALTLWGTDNYGQGLGQNLTMTITTAPVNRAPVVASPLVDQTVSTGTAFTYTVPSTSFTDPDAGDTLTYTATLADGSALPAWLTFNTSTRKLSGTPTSAATLSVKVTAKDTGNLTASDIFDVVVNVPNLTLNGTSSANTLTGGDGNDTLNGLGGNDKLIGGAGNDLLDGGTGNDTMLGELGNDIYIVDSTSDVVTENVNEGIDQVKSSVTYTLIANLESLLLTNTSAINGTGNTLDNLLIGNSGKNILNGAAGNDILQGMAGDDTLTDTLGNNIFDGGAGVDIITAGVGNDFIAGGLGNDTITTGTGADVIAFNRGDGMDTINASTGKDNTISLGKGIKYADLLFKKTGNDLILVTGTSEQITLKDWYLNVNNHSVANLQMVIEGTTDYNATSTNKLNNKKIEQFNFDGLVTKFDQARVANPSLTSWALSSSLLEFYLAGSDAAALGGDLAYQYAKNGNLSNFSMTPAHAIMVGGFGSGNQVLQATSALRDASVNLS